MTAEARKTRTIAPAFVFATSYVQPPTFPQCPESQDPDWEGKFNLNGLWSGTEDSIHEDELESSLAALPNTLSGSQISGQVGTVPEYPVDRKTRAARPEKDCFRWTWYKRAKSDSILTRNPSRKEENRMVVTDDGYSVGCLLALNALN